MTVLTEKNSRSFTNGAVYLLHTEDGMPLETTDTFLPFYTKDAIGRKQNDLTSGDVGDRSERWMIGVSVASGCPVRCKFCLVPGTQISMSNFETRPVEDIKLDDYVLSNVLTAASNRYTSYSSVFSRWKHYCKKIGNLDLNCVDK